MWSVLKKFPILFLLIAIICFISVALLFDVMGRPIYPPNRFPYPSVGKLIFSLLFWLLFFLDLIFMAKRSRIAYISGVAIFLLGFAENIYSYAIGKRNLFAFVAVAFIWSFTAIC